MANFVTLGCTDQGGVLRRMFVYTDLDVHRLGPVEAAKAGFSLSDDGKRWFRNITPEIIALEMRGYNFAFARVIAAGEALPDTSFREAWVDNRGQVAVDMDKAREIHRDRVRALREPVFADLDRAFTRAQGRAAVLDGPRKAEAEATMRAIEAQRQALRDAPADPAIDAAKTPDELKAAIPDVLKD